MSQLNVIRQAVAGMQVTRKSALSDLVTYQRAQFPILTGLLATPGKTQFAIDDGTSVRLASKQQDWIVTASDLVLPGTTSPTLPLKGDRITITTGQLAGIFEVHIPDSSDQPYQLDQTGTQLRIHTKKVG